MVVYITIPTQIMLCGETIQQKEHSNSMLYKQSNPVKKFAQTMVKVTYGVVSNNKLSVQYKQIKKMEIMIIGMFLGMVMVLGILGVIVVVRMYSNIKKLKGLVRTQQEIINNIYLRIDEVDQMINRRIDGEIDRTNKLNETTNRHITTNIDEIYRFVDSRLDKLTNKLNPSKKDLLQD